MSLAVLVEYLDGHQGRHDRIERRDRGQGQGRCRVAQVRRARSTGAGLLRRTRRVEEAPDIAAAAAAGVVTAILAGGLCVVVVVVAIWDSADLGVGLGVAVPAAEAGNALGWGGSGARRHQELCDASCRSR